MITLRQLPHLRTAIGIGRAWKNHRASQRPAQRWALEEGDEGWAIFWDVDTALKDRLDEGYRIAVLRPCEIAFPPNLGIEDRIELLNETPEDVADWSDFAAQEEDVVQFPGHRANLLRDLERMVAATFRAWAEKHGCQRLAGDVEINAWKFTGPWRRFEHDGQAWHEVTPT